MLPFPFLKYSIIVILWTFCYLKLQLNENINNNNNNNHSGFSFHIRKYMGVNSDVHSGMRTCEGNIGCVRLAPLGRPRCVAGFLLGRTWVIICTRSSWGKKNRHTPGSKLNERTHCVTDSRRKVPHGKNVVTYSRCKF